MDECTFSWGKEDANVLTVLTGCDRGSAGRLSTASRPLCIDDFNFHFDVDPTHHGLYSLRAVGWYRFYICDLADGTGLRRKQHIFAYVCTITVRSAKRERNRKRITA